MWRVFSPNCAPPTSGNTARRRGGRSIPCFPTAKWSAPGWRRCLICGRRWKLISRGARRLLAAPGLDGVVALARLGFQVLVGQPDFQLPVRSILHLVAGGVADGVLAAHLVLELLKRFFQRVLPVDFKNPAAGFVRHLAQFALAAASA